jgi:hypothetical protein
VVALKDVEVGGRLGQARVVQQQSNQAQAHLPAPGVEFDGACVVFQGFRDDPLELQGAATDFQGVGALGLDFYQRSVSFSTTAKFNAVRWPRARASRIQGVCGLSAVASCRRTRSIG